MNELLINALKHGFGVDGQGEVAVRAEWSDQRIAVTVADTGKGLPAGFDFRTFSSLGLRLVTLLTEQLGAEMRWPMAGQPGSVFTLLLPTGVRPS